MKKYQGYQYEGGEDAEAEPEAPAEQPAEEEAPLVEEKADSEDPEEALRLRVKEIEDQMCCCCICKCQGEEDKPYTCCGCLPIKCGLVTIGILTITLTFALFVEVFYTLLNEYIHWWYVIVASICLIPVVIGTVFVIRFFTKDQAGSRTRMWVAMLLSIASFSLLCIWNLIYFQWIYKYDTVYAGADVIGYTMQTKKSFMVWNLFVGILLDFIWAYFLCVATAYASCKDGPPEPVDYTGGAGNVANPF